MMRASELHLSILYDELHKYLYDSQVVHADETPFEVIQDGRKAGAKSYMWVYRTGQFNEKHHPVIIYDFQSTRKTDHPQHFLKDYSGVLLTDGYQVYHSLEKKRDDLTVAGCWIHAKRNFADYVKSGLTGLDETIDAQAVKLISELFHLDHQCGDCTAEERLKHRQLVVKPKVDAFFAWVKESSQKVSAGSNTYKNLQYCIHQEKFLRVFLSNGAVPMDNNLAEQAIRPFTLGRKNWVNMASIRGAQASAILYSLVETAKANNLRVYEYLEYLLTELPRHADDTSRDFLKDLLPWSEKVQEKCRSLKKSE